MPSLLEPKIHASGGTPPPGRGDENRSRSTVIGIVATIVIHVLIFLLAPAIMKSDFGDQSLTVAPSPPVHEMEINLTPEEDTLAPKTAFKFVETNPNLPDNPPDKTENFARQNQQAAQPDPDKETKSDRGKTEGKDIPSNQIVVGQLTKPLEAVTPPAAPEVKETPSTAAPRQEQTPLNGFEKKEAENPDGIASNLSKATDHAQPVADEVKGQKSAAPDATSSVVTAQASKRQPAPRPKLDPNQVRPGILQNRPIGVAHAGHIGVDARFSEYGDYLSQLIEIVQIEWDRINRESAVSPPQGSKVTVTFRINSQGEIAETIEVKDDGAGTQGKYACTTAIRARAPYRKWTPDMIAVLGDSQELTFTFYYW